MQFVYVQEICELIKITHKGALDLNTRMSININSNKNL